MHRCGHAFLKDGLAYSAVPAAKGRVSMTQSLERSANLKEQAGHVYPGGTNVYSAVIVAQKIA